MRAYGAVGSLESRQGLPDRHPIEPPRQGRQVPFNELCPVHDVDVIDPAEPELVALPVGVPLGDSMVGARMGGQIGVPHL